jgi:hypothetical protein
MELRLQKCNITRKNAQLRFGGKPMRLHTFVCDYVGKKCNSTRERQA